MSRDEDWPGEFDDVPDGDPAPQKDHLGPPEQSCEVTCIECGQRYDSSRIMWVEEVDEEGNQEGVWRCPTPGCGGAGFGFDIFPVDPAAVGGADAGCGWFDDDGEPMPPPWLTEGGDGVGGRGDVVVGGVAGVDDLDIPFDDPDHARTPETDCFRPPKKNCEVICMHCQERYDSYRITWVERTGADGTKDGCWCCPTPGCDGKGFGFDIHPFDPDFEDEEDRGIGAGGWFDDDGNPAPPPWKVSDEELEERERQREGDGHEKGGEEET